MPGLHFGRGKPPLRENLAELYDAIEATNRGHAFVHPLEQIKAKIQLLEIHAAERTASRLARATWALFASTAVLAAATIVLAVRS